MAARSRKWVRWVVVAVVVAGTLAVAGPWVYFEYVQEDAPPRLELSPVTATTASGSTRVALAGTWRVGRGSRAGYRVKEVLLGRDNEAAGRTTEVSGAVTIAGTTVQSANVEVDLASVRSDESRRDNQFRGRIMDVARFPRATFALTEPIELGAEPPEGKRVKVDAVGTLTLRGTTRPVTAAIEALRTGNTLEVIGTIPVTFADYGIPNPSFAIVTTEDRGIVEFLLRLTHD
jgi:polyisoprenoid-binding protein YceI